MRPWNLLLPVWVTPHGRPLLPLFFLAGGPSAAVPAAVAAVILAEGCIASLAIANFVAGSQTYRYSKKLDTVSALRSDHVR